MTPENTGLSSAAYDVYADRTYLIDPKKGRISGYCDGLGAVRQAIYKILSTVRYEYIIYSDNYGTRLIDCMGSLTPYMWAEIERIIRTALLYDDRINRVYGFRFEERGRVLYVTFSVDTDLGSLEYTQEVGENV